VRGVRRGAVRALRDVPRQLQGLRRRREVPRAPAWLLPSVPGLQRERAHPMPRVLLLIDDCWIYLDCSVVIWKENGRLQGFFFSVCQVACS
jgi:hypothetical protein